MDDSEIDLNQLKADLYSDVWETSLGAADMLSQLNTNEANDILIEALSSTNNFIRNASALGIREANSKKAFDALFNRINELGPNEEIGTLVYCLETANCTDYLVDLIELYFRNQGLEVRSALTFIFNEQQFVLTKAQVEMLRNVLEKYNSTIQNFKLNITVT